MKPGSRLSPEPFHKALAPEALTAANEAAEWRGRCRKCKEPLKGTLAQLKEHVCAENS